jgi:hypothetical protein
MSSQDPRGFVSPDGRWRWDGTSWVPNTAAPPRRGGIQTRWVVVLIAAGTLLVLLLAGAGIFVVTRLGESLQRNFGVHTTTACLPSDFPSYPGAERAFAFTLGKICSESYTTADAPDAVLTFYEAQLSNPPWRLARSSTATTVFFGRTDKPEATGNVQAIKDRGGAQITITYAP